jgi:hypothetical protein
MTDPQRGSSRALVLGLSLAALALAGCEPPFGSCKATPAPHIEFTSPVDHTATVGLVYFQGISGGAAQLLGVSAALHPVSVPGGAEVSAHGVSWTPGPDDAGTTRRFEVRTSEDLCLDSRSLSWSVQVFPAMTVSRFDATPAAVSTRGGMVTIAADYAGGTGVLASPVARALPSGQPVTVGPITSDTTFTLVVTNAGGDALERQLTVIAQAPPAAVQVGWWPDMVTSGEPITLTWTLSGTVTSLVLDPGGIALLPTTTSFQVPAAEPVTYTLTARNDVGDVTVVPITPAVHPPPAIASFTVTPASPPLGSTAELTAVFTGGAGNVTPQVNGAMAFEVASGVPVQVGPLKGNARYTLRVTSPTGSAVMRDLVVGLSGPGSWEVLAVDAGDGPRSGSTVTGLPDGRVLVAGGSWYTGSGWAYAYPPATELLDPATGAFEQGPPLLHPRGGHAAVLLASGRVLVVGGIVSFPYGTPLPTSELLDPAAGTSQEVADTGGFATWQGSFPQALALPDGGALVLTRFMYANTTVWRFDPAALAISPLATVYGLGEVRPFLLPDGTVLLLSGGRDGATPSAILDPAGGTVAWTGALLRPLRSGFVSGQLADGRVLASDGQPGAQLYDPATGSFTQVGDPISRTSGGLAAPLPDGRLLLACSQFELFDPATGSFTETGGAFGGGDGLVVLPDGDVVLVTASGQAERYRPPPR